MCCRGMMICSEKANASVWQPFFLLRFLKTCRSIDDNQETCTRSEFLERNLGVECPWLVNSNFLYNFMNCSRFLHSNLHHSMSELMNSWIAVNSFGNSSAVLCKFFSCCLDTPQMELYDHKFAENPAVLQLMACLNLSGSPINSHAASESCDLWEIHNFCWVPS
jgi:hypothetical protein